MPDKTSRWFPVAAAPPLVGREREQVALRAALAAARAGRGALVLIGGEAGIGKTTLAEALCAEAAAQGAAVLVGRCYDLSETPPYGPWEDAVAALAGWDTDLPLPTFGRASEAASQGAIFGQVRDFLMALAARQPLVVVLDDLHWADQASLDLLRFLARGLATSPILVVVAYRPEEITRQHLLYALIPVLVHEAPTVRLELHPLDEAAVRTLTRARYALPPAEEARLIAYLQARAEGTPLYLGEVLRSLEEAALLYSAGGGWFLGDLAQAHVPVLLRQIIDQRVGRLGASAQHFLPIAATIGQDVPYTLWATVGETSEAALVEIAEQAVEAHLLAETADGRGVRFTHALIRAALYEGILPSRRGAWHRRMAEVLAAQPRPDTDAVAYHFRQVGDARAIEWLIAAGDQAYRTFAVQTAMARYEVALTLLGEDADPGRRGWLRLRLARASFFADPRGGVAAFEQAAQLGVAAGDRALEVIAIHQAGFNRAGLGEYRRGLEEMSRALGAVARLTAEEQASLTAHGIRADAMWQTFFARLAQAGRYTEVLALAAERTARGLPLGVHAYAALAEALGFQGRVAEARVAWDDCLAAARASGDTFGEGTWGVVAWFRFTLPYEADQRELRQCRAVAAEQAMARASAQVAEEVRIARLPLLWLEGHWAEARRLALALYATTRTYRMNMPRVLLSLALAQGDTTLATRMVREQFPAGPDEEPGDTMYDPAVAMQPLASALALEAGDLPTARAWLEAHDRWLAWGGAVLGRAAGQLGWAQYYRAVGDPGQAQAAADRALAFAGEPRQPLLLLAAHRCLGELAIVAGQYEEAARHLDLSLALADACAAPYERALSLLAMAELRCATTDREGADAALGAARALLVPLEARPALVRADALAAKLAPGRLAAGYSDRLTAREVDVLLLVAAGRSNREIAAALSISERTVGRHLENLYRKVGARNRADATAYALRHHLT